MKKIIALAATMMMLVSIPAAKVYCEQTKSGEVASNILRLIEIYKAPPYPVEKLPEKQPGTLDLQFTITKETYDYRKAWNETIPPTLIDALITDLWQRMTNDLAIEGITPSKVSEDHVIQAIDIYLQRDWENIAGYRPWTHWNFIRSLTKEQRNGLAKEVAAYVHDNGVKEGN